MRGIGISNEDRCFYPHFVPPFLSYYHQFSPIYVCDTYKVDSHTPGCVLPVAGTIGDRIHPVPKKEATGPFGVRRNSPTMRAAVGLSATLCWWWVSGRTNSDRRRVDRVSSRNRRLYLTGEVGHREVAAITFASPTFGAHLVGATSPSPE